ncbi:TlpA family protein disulfide reductase [Trebonia kvetii]|uniref:TlpA family protein disulfide reductase n=1 Tax=Trebonia kvetii TaxID=2480626 RepID=A0A6P2BQY2_9ACTN|nr:TlpA disulfide reductase family protein [Trebonia kvetii]TVZ01489.1 TlpA family protein disulfide reductase [Trebonia kvetii]
MFRAKRRMVVIATAVLAVLLAGGLAIGLLSQEKGNASADGIIAYQAGQRPAAPEFTGTSLTGTTIRLSSYLGKTVVLNFWGSWCPPCRDEAPTLEVLAQQYGKQGVAFLGDDVHDSPANALAFTQRLRISYPSINDPGYLVVQQFSQVAPVSDTPTTVVIDKTGHVAGLILGAVSYSQLTTLLRDAAVTQ